MTNKAHILDILETLAGVYDKEPGKPDAYFWTLEEYDNDTITAAAKRHVKASKWYPKPAELVEACERIMAEGQSPSDDNSRRYWQAMSEYGEVLRGDSDERILTTSKAWQWCNRLGTLTPVSDMQPTADALV